MTWKGLWAFPPYRWLRQSICPHRDTYETPGRLECYACGAVQMKGAR